MSQTMHALVFDGTLRLETIPLPTPDPGEVLLKTRRAGICNTDRELTRGYKNFSGVLGHEFVAEVAAGPAEWLGQRVAGEINIVDSECDMCRQGIYSQCRNRRALGIYRYDGCFAEYFTLPLRNLHRVPDSISDDQAVFTEPLAAALQVLEATHISPRDRVVLLGAGKLGMLIAQVLQLTGADLVVAVRSEKQTALLARRGIATAAHDELPAQQADVVIECTGNAAGFAKALNLVRPRGRIILKSTYEGLPSADLSRIAVDEIRVIGSRCGPFKAALDLLADGLVDVESLIEAHYSLEDGLQAFEHAAQRGVLKVLLSF